MDWRLLRILHGVKHLLDDGGQLFARCGLPPNQQTLQSIDALCRSRDRRNRNVVLFQPVATGQGCRWEQGLRLQQIEWISNTK